MIVAFYIIVFELCALLLALIYKGIVILIELIDAEFFINSNSKLKKEKIRRNKNYGIINK